MKLNTDRKADPENVQNIKTSELRYRRLFEAAQDGILLLNAETGMSTDINPFLVKVLGYTRKGFMKKRLWEVGAFKDVEASQKAFKALQKNEYIRYEDLPLRASRTGLSLGIMVLDVDHFKRFNDTGGHAASGKILGALLLGHFRGEDVACRYGGDEFGIVLPEASLEKTRERKWLWQTNNYSAGSFQSECQIQ